MVYLKLRKISFGVGVAAAGAMPLVPIVFNWLHPSKPVAVGQGFVGLASFAVDILGVIGDGILVMVWIAGFSVVAVIASLISLLSAWAGRESRRTKVLCGLPALLVVLGYGALFALGA